MSELLDFVPTLRTDLLRHEMGGETIVWSPLAIEPTVLDPVATVMLDVIDGEATVGKLAIEVHEEVGVALDVAQQQVGRTVELFGRAGLLTASTSTTTAKVAIVNRELFVNPCTSCMENAVRGMTLLSLRFGDRTIGVACDARRGVRKLRSALIDHIVDVPDAPVAFILTAPAGLQRSHHLADRSGFVLSDGRGFDSGLHALASHLTAFLPPAPGTVRVRAGAIADGESVVVCVFPLLLMPQIKVGVLADSHFGLIDRLALDIEVSTGRVVNPPIPWPNLAALGLGAEHLGPTGSGRVLAVLSPNLPGRPPPSRASVVATLAGGALHGEPRDVLQAVVRLIDGAEHRSTGLEAPAWSNVLASLRTPAI